jgi:hypothetical protein
MCIKRKRQQKQKNEHKPLLPFTPAVVLMFNTCQSQMIQAQQLLAKDLPDDIVTQIFDVGHFDPRTLYNCGNVCKQWRTLSGSDEVWV